LSSKLFFLPSFLSLKREKKKKEKMHDREKVKKKLRGETERRGKERKGKEREEIGNQY